MGAHFGHLKELFIDSPIVFEDSPGNNNSDFIYYFLDL